LQTLKLNFIGQQKTMVVNMYAVVGLALMSASMQHWTP
jgi:hypothetical protein